MRFRGGYNVLVSGKADNSIIDMPIPSKLSLSLITKRFNFSNVKVASGDKVSVGDVLAFDSGNYNIPLLSPANATVELQDDSSCIELINIDKSTPYPSEPVINDSVATETSELRIGKLINNGAWEYFFDAFNTKLPAPDMTPQAIIVSTLSLEPFVARGDVQLNGNLDSFIKGLEHLHLLHKDKYVYIVLPKKQYELKQDIANCIGDFAWCKTIEIELKYPYDNFNIIARHLGLRSSNGPVWGLRTEGVLAVDKVLTSSRACIERIVSVSGPTIENPTNIRITAGFPIEDIISEFNIPEDTRIINGGILTGVNMTDDVAEVCNECRGITLVPEHTQREFLGWMRPGFGKRGYAKCFASLLRPSFNERLTTAVRGEVRACISCGFCQEVCPAGIIPHMLHKYLYRDQIEEAMAARIDLCVQCGLCSYVCTSKIELREQFTKALAVIEEEKEAARQAQEKQAAQQQQNQQQEADDSQG